MVRGGIIKIRKETGEIDGQYLMKQNDDTT
jgi:hypothetical protein